MTIRTPLKLVGSDLREMTAAEIDSIKLEAIRQYGLNPSVTLSVVSSGGNLGTLSDTRLQAGTGIISKSNANLTSANTENVSTVTVSYSRMNQSYNTAGSSWSNATFSYPLYYDGANLREMSAADFADTFIYPAIDSLTSGSTGTGQAGTYYISTSSSGAVSGTPVFTDTRANAGAYNASTLLETRDQPTTITNYYLQKVNPASEGSYQLPVCYTKSGTNLYQTPADTFRDALSTMVRYYAAEVAGTKIAYSINGTGSNRGTAMVDTKLNSSVFLSETERVSPTADTDYDYRAQEAPAGSATTISTYNLRISQI